MIAPRLSKQGNSSHLIVWRVDELAETLILPGAARGAGRRKKEENETSFKFVSV